MARYSATVTSGAALADDTGFAWLMGSASAGGKLRRVVIGCAGPYRDLCILEPERRRRDPADP